jgi:exodeoxyribonuclease-1
MDKASYERLKLHPELVQNHLKKLMAADGFGEKLLEARELMWPKPQTQMVVDAIKVDNLLYDGFIKDEDKTVMSALRAARPEEIADFADQFKDERLKGLVPLYKARNYPKSLTAQEKAAWDSFCRQKLINKVFEEFFSRLNDVSKMPGITDEQQYLLEELNLYAQSITAAD